MSEQARHRLIFWELMQVLHDAPGLSWRPDADLHRRRTLPTATATSARPP